MKIMNVKFPVWMIYKKGFYSLFRLVMDFGCYYCHVLRDSFSDVVKHSASVHEFDKLKIRSRELNVITGKIGYRTHNFNIIPNEIKVNRQKNDVKCGEPGNLSIRISGHHNEDVSILKNPLSKKFKFSEHSDLNELQTSCDNSGTFLKDDNLNVDDQTLPELEFEVNDDDTNREILISQIPQVMQAMKDIGQLDTRIKFNDMIISKEFLFSNITFLLFMDVVRWFSETICNN